MRRERREKDLKFYEDIPHRAFIYRIFHNYWHSFSFQSFDQLNLLLSKVCKFRDTFQITNGRDVSLYFSILIKSRFNRILIYNFFIKKRMRNYEKCSTLIKEKIVT